MKVYGVVDVQTHVLLASALTAVSGHLSALAGLSLGKWKAYPRVALLSPDWLGNGFTDEKFVACCEV
jgi:hypothetical protein